MAGRAMNEATKQPIQSVLIKDVDLDDDLFRMTFCPSLENLKISMAKVGLAINLIGIVIISLVFYFVGTAVLGIDIATFPKWAAPG